MPEAGPGRTAAEDPARQEALIANLRAQVQTLEAQVLACRRTEAQLRESETRFRNLAETTSDWIWEVDTAGVYTYVSPQVRDLLGYEPSEVLGRTPFDFIPDDERARVWPAFEAACARREPIRALVNRNRRKDGRIVVLETSGVPFAGPQGELAGYRGIDRDITERVRVEEVRQFLAEAGRALVSSLDCRTTLESVAHLAVPVLADWVVIDVRGAEPGSHTAAVAYVDPIPWRPTGACCSGTSRNWYRRSPPRACGRLPAVRASCACSGSCAPPPSLSCPWPLAAAPLAP